MSTATPEGTKNGGFRFVDGDPVAELRRLADAIESGSIKAYSIGQVEHGDDDDCHYVGTSELRVEFANHDAVPDPMIRLHAQIDAHLAASAK